VPRESGIVVRQGAEADRDWIKGLLRKYWASTNIASRGQLHDASRLPALVAVLKGRRIGLLTYRIAEDECEIVTLNSVSENTGAGTALVQAAEHRASLEGCTRMRLITTNDNTNALHFYQKRGFHIVAVRLKAIERARKLKPEIPVSGLDGIPISDEIELEKSI